MASNRVAFVTGGSNGLGLSICSILVENGYRVCCGDIVKSTAFEVLQATCGTDVLHYVYCDVSDLECYERAIRECIAVFGDLNVLCANAGIAGEERWKQMIDVNLMGTIYGIRLALKYMSNRAKNSPPATIMVTASVLSYFVIPDNPVYCASKFGVMGYLQGMLLDEEFKRSGIHLNAVCPPPMPTKILHDANTSFMAEMKELHNLQIEPVEVAKHIHRLIEEKAHGQIICIDIDGSVHVEHSPTLENWIERNKPKQTVVA